MPRRPEDLLGRLLQVAAVLAFLAGLASAWFDLSARVRVLESKQEFLHGAWEFVPRQRTNGGTP
jgi:hypothetical protein